MISVCLRWMVVAAMSVHGLVVCPLLGVWPMTVLVCRWLFAAMQVPPLDPLSVGMALDR